MDKRKATAGHSGATSSDDDLPAATGAPRRTTRVPRGAAPADAPTATAAPAQAASGTSASNDDIAQLLKAIDEDLKGRRGLADDDLDDDEDEDAEPARGVPFGRIAVALFAAAGVGLGVVLLDSYDPAAGPAAPEAVTVAAPAVAPIGSAEPPAATPAIPPRGGAPGDIPQPLLSRPDLPSPAAETPPAPEMPMAERMLAAETAPLDPPAQPSEPDTSGEAATEAADTAAEADAPPPVPVPQGGRSEAPPLTATAPTPAGDAVAEVPAEVAVPVRRAPTPAPAPPPAMESAPPPGAPQAGMDGDDGATQAPDPMVDASPDGDLGDATPPADAGDLQAALAAPPPAPPPAADAPVRRNGPAAAVPGGRFVVQVGTFREVGNATALVRRLNDRGYRAFTMDWTGRDDRAWTVVRVGGYPSRGAAGDIAEALKQDFGLDPIVLGLR